MLSVAEILARAASAYASCRTYCDEGTHTTDFIDGSNLWRWKTTGVQFKTSFLRGTGFLFAFRTFTVASPSPGFHAAEARDASEPLALGIDTWATIRDRLPDPAQTIRVAPASDGISGGIAAATASVLTPGPSSDSLLPAGGDARELGEDDIEGRRCFGVQGTTHQGERFDVWIDAESFLVLRRTTRKVVDEAWRTQRRKRWLARLDLNREDRAAVERTLAHLSKGPQRNYRTETTTSWRPQIDLDIDPSVFAGESD